MKYLISITVIVSLCFPLDLFAGGKSYSGGSGGRSYSGSSGGSSFKPSGGRSYSGTPSPIKGVSGIKPPANLSPSQKPSSVSIDKAAVRDNKTVESRVAYTAATQKDIVPKPSYTNSHGHIVNLHPSDKRVESVRNVPHEKLVNRDVRVHTTYRVYYNRASYFPPTVIYHDSYNQFFWFWLLDRSLDERAMWMYHHHDTVDPGRYQYLVSKDAQLEYRIRQLEQQKVAKDNSYVPIGLDPDLQYDDGFVHASVNPQHVESHSSGFGVVLSWLCGGLFVLLIIGVIVYFMFVYKY